MDLNNSALIEAFNKKYGMTPKERQSLGITDEDWEKTKRRFAEKWYADQDGRATPKATLKATTKATPTPKPTASPSASSVYKEFSKGWKERFGFDKK